MAGGRWSNGTACSGARIPGAADEDLMTHAMSEHEACGERLGQGVVRHRRGHGVWTPDPGDAADDHETFVCTDQKRRRGQHLPTQRLRNPQRAPSKRLDFLDCLAHHPVLALLCLSDAFIVTPT